MAVAGLPTDQDTLPLTASDLPELADIATAFPDLEIIEKIGQGGMGVVFKARQPKLDRLVALKVLPKALATTPGFPERFTREGRVLARLSHPSIVTVHDFGESGGYCFLIMEYVDGVNLRQAMNAGRFTPEQALKVVPDICAALQAAHEQGVLHRDIKPENLLLDTKGRIKIADFGIAKLLDDRGADLLLTQSGAKLGTAPYMAPEQIEQPSTVDHRADIYSLGVVLYEMLTGELPLGRFAAPSEKSAVGGNIDEIVFRALEKERGRRQQSASEFKTQIEGATAMSALRPVYRKRGEPFQYKSKRLLCGLPLLHIVSGRDPVTGAVRTANGFFALGDKARGVFAFGGMAHGYFACGGIATGLVTFGGLSFGLISVGGLALGLLFACGGLGIGTLATGGLAIGYHACGGIVTAWHGMGGLVIAHQGHGSTVHAAEVVKNMLLMPRLTVWLGSVTPYISLLGVLWLPVSAFVFIAHWWARNEAGIESGEIPRDASSSRIFWVVPAILALCLGYWWIIACFVGSHVAEISQMIVPVVVSTAGLVMFAVGVPLWLRLVPVNPIFGLRLPSTMATDERWYESNAFAGKHLFGWSLMVIGAGFAGFHQLPRHQDDYPWAAVALLLAAVASLLVSTWWWLRQHPQNAPARPRNRLVGWGGQAFVAVIIAMFIRSFIITPYSIPQASEPGVTKGSHWIASRIDSGFDQGDLIVYEHTSSQAWIARVVKREPDGLLLKRGGSADTFFVKWDKVIGKMLFSHFTPDALKQTTTQVTPTSASKPAGSVSQNSQLSVKKPELRYVRMRLEDKPWSAETYDADGRLLEISPQMLKALSEDTTGISADDPEACWMQLWFHDTEFDGFSLQGAQLVDAEGKLLPPVSNAVPHPEMTTMAGLHSVTLRVGSRGDPVKTYGIRLSYSAGPWTSSKKIEHSFRGSIGTQDWVLGTVGEKPEIGSFVAWTKRSATKQVQCVAHLKDGSQRAVGNSSMTSNGLIVEHAEFSKLQLKDIDHFILRSRDIHEVLYENVTPPPLPMEDQRRIQITGFGKKGSLEWRRGMKVSEVIMLWGGITNPARKRIQLTRDGMPMVIQENQAHEVETKADDQITIITE
jgi:tRNA A-37 threonylcarbamoyl transferase component Bud32